MVDFTNQFADEVYDGVEGLIEDSGQQGKYITVFDGSLCQRSDKQIEGWEGPIITVNNKTNPPTEKATYVLRYDKLIGRVVDFHKVKREFSAEKGGGSVTNWNFTILANGEFLTLQLTYMSRVLKRFLKVLPNVILQRPLMISVFNSKDGKIAVSFKQCQDAQFDRNIGTWAKVEEYWLPERDERGKPIPGTAYMAPDSTVLPEAIHDEGNDEWDFKPQERWLAKYFIDNVQPQIKAIAATHNVSHEDRTVGADGKEDSTPLMTGAPTQPQFTGNPAVRPAVVIAQSIGEFASAQTIQNIRLGSQSLGFDADAVCRKAVGAGLNEINEAAGQHVCYLLAQRIQSTQAVQPAAPVAPVAPVAPIAPPPPVMQAPVAQVIPDFGMDNIPSVTYQPPAPQPPPAPAANAPVDWSALATPTPQTFDPTTNDDIPFG